MFKEQILNIRKALTKVEQRNVFGGYVNPDGCCVWITYKDGYKYKSCGLSIEEAQGLYGTHYDNLGGSGPADVTGYCCASC